MKELFKNKLFLVLLSAFFFIIIFNSKCFANFDFEYDNNFYSVPYLPAGYNYYLISINTNPRYRYVVCSNTPITYHCWYNGDSPVAEVFSDTLYVAVFNNDNLWYDSTDTSFRDSYLFRDQLIYSNFDVYNTYQSHNELVFQAPPQQVEEQETPQQIQQVTIPAIQQVEEIPQGMSQVLQMIIPIGLIVLSIGLVVYLTRLVIYRMKS